MMKYDQIMAKQMPSGLPKPDPGYEWRVDLSDHIRPSAVRNRRLENRMIWVQVALLTIGTTALLWGAFAHIGWLFWGIGLPIEIIALVYTYVAAGFIVLWAKERQAAASRDTT